MDLGHTALQFLRKLASTQVDVQHGGLNTSVTGKQRDFVKVPTSASEIRQAEMTERVGREPAHSSALGDILNDLGPGPDGNGLAAITSRSRDEQGSTLPAQRATFPEILGKELSRRR